MKLPWRAEHKRRGAGLLTVLVTSSLLLMLGLTVAGTSFHHLSVSNRLHHAQAARNLAEDCLAKGIAQIMANHNAHQPSSPGVFPAIQGAPGVDADGRGYLTFDPAELPTLNGKLSSIKLVKSYNNFGVDSPQPLGNGKMVPANSAYLMAVGTDHGVERAVECVLYVPPFPYALASGGEVKLSGDSRVASVDNMADATDISKHKPGSLVTNATTGNTAMVLDGDNVVVNGDLQSASGATISANSVVKGEKRLNAGAVKLPKMTIEDYNTIAKPGVTTFNSSAGPSTVSGFAYREGALNFSSGLTLNTGVVYVKGDVTINGEIKGSGAIVATGKLTINGTGELYSGNKVALLSKEDMTIRGTASERLTTNGLLYTEGKFTAENANFFGGAIAPEAGGMDLSNVSMYHVEENMSVTIGGGTTSGGGGGFGGTSGTGNIGSPATASGGNWAPVGSLPIFDWGITAQITAPASRFLDSNNQYHVVYESTVAGRARDINDNNLPPGRYVSAQGGARGYYDVPAPATSVAPLNPADITVTINGEAVSPNDPQYTTKLHNAIQANAAAAKGGALTPTEIAVANAMVDAFFGAPNLVQNVFMNNSGGQEKLRVPSFAAEQYNITPNITATTFTPYQDSSNTWYVDWADRIKVLYWRDIPQ